MKIIAEASQEFWDSFCQTAQCDMEKAKKSLEASIRRRLELRPDKDEVEIRAVKKGD